VLYGVGFPTTEIVKFRDVITGVDVGVAVLVAVLVGNGVGVDVGGIIVPQVAALAIATALLALGIIAVRFSPVAAVKFFGFPLWYKIA